MAAASSVRQQTTRRLLACGAAGGPLFVTAFLVDGATRAGYDPMTHAVSQLSLGGRGWLQITNFVVTGLLMLAFAVGLRRALHPGRGATWGPLLVGAYALALVGSGVFVMDPMHGYPPGTPPGLGADPSWHHTVHDSLGAVVFLSLPAASLVVARRFAADPGARGWAVYSAATGVAMVVLFVAFGAAWEDGSATAGLLQRATIIVGWGWIALLAARLPTGQRQPGAVSRPSGRSGTG